MGSEKRLIIAELTNKADKCIVKFKYEDCFENKSHSIVGVRKKRIISR